MATVDPSEMWNLYGGAQKELDESESNLKRLGKASIKVQSFNSMVDKMDPEDDEYTKFREAAAGLNKRLDVLATRRSKERKVMEEEMESAHIPVKRITEMQDGDAESNREFYEKQSSRMDNIIMSTMDSLESLRLQGKYIDSTRMMINEGLKRMGVSNRLINKIESKITMDKILFIALFVVLLLIIVVFMVK